VSSSLWSLQVHTFYFPSREAAHRNLALTSNCEEPLLVAGVVPKSMRRLHAIDSKALILKATRLLYAKAVR